MDREEEIVIFRQLVAGPDVPATSASGYWVPQPVERPDAVTCVSRDSQRLTWKRRPGFAPKALRHGNLSSGYFLFHL